MYFVRTMLARIARVLELVRMTVLTHRGLALSTRAGFDSPALDSF